MGSRMEDHCLCLFAYASHHPDGMVSLKEASSECGIPKGTLKALVYFHRNHGEPNLYLAGKMRTCYLCATALKYRYSFRIRSIKNEIYIEAVSRGYTQY